MNKTPRTTVGKLYAMLLPRERRNMWVLLGAVIVMAGFQTAGVGAISPFMSVAANPESIETNEMLSTLYELGGFGSARSFLIALGIGVIAIMVVGNGFTAFTMYWLYRYVQMRNYSLSHRLFRQYLYQPYSYFLKVNTGNLSKNILSEVGQVINGLLRPLAEAVAKGALVLALVGFLFVSDPIIALVAIGVLTLGYGGVIFGLKPIQLRLGVRRRESNRERFQAAGEGFGAVKDVKIRGTEPNFERQFSTAAKEFSWATAMNQILANVPKFILEGIAFALIILMVLVLLATEENFAAAIPLLSVYAFAGYRLMPAMQFVFRGVSQLRFNAPAVDGLYADLVDGGDRFAQVKALEATVPPAETVPPRANGSEAKGDLEGVGFEDSIALKDVSFTYESAGAPVLENISLNIQKNTTVGFVGPTGCGKTTLIDIVLGLLEPTDGELLVDGRPVPENRKRKWQRSFGYVPQEIFLSDQSIRRNIAFGIPEEQVDSARMEQAARIANVHDFIVNELPQGYDSAVGERGIRLSGGQRQRIGIARALYHDPEILVMDEATSALDSVTEEAVMDAIHALMHSKTIILIAHRITTVQECDRIYMLERGQVVAEGGYEELLRNNPRFRAMAKVAG